jgi:membrane associated rhomboid family serine protease
MIPISDKTRFQSKPIINYGLIWINITIFLGELILELKDGLDSFVTDWGLVPAQISAAITNAISSTTAAWIVVCWRSLSLVSAMFIHGSFSQILGNLLFLWVFGRTLENILGHRGFLWLYLGAGVLTAVVQVVVEPSLQTPLVGANGAVASILGAYIIKFPQAKIDTVIPLLIVYIPTELPALFYLFWWFGQQLFYSIGSLNTSCGSIAQWAQVVGLFIGAGFIKLKG